MIFIIPTTKCEIPALLSDEEKIKSLIESGVTFRSYDMSLDGFDYDIRTSTDYLADKNEIESIANPEYLSSWLNNHIELNMDKDTFIDLAHQAIEGKYAKPRQATIMILDAMSLTFVQTCNANNIMAVAQDIVDYHEGENGVIYANGHLRWEGAVDDDMLVTVEDEGKENID